MAIERRIAALRAEKRQLKQAAQLLSDYYRGELKERAFRVRYRKAMLLPDLDFEIPPEEESLAMKVRARELTPNINAAKASLYEALDRMDGTRAFREEFLSPYNVISIFDSALLRIIGAEPNTLTTDLVVVKTCYFKVLKDIISHGFTLRGERYVIYTASAGQIRTKRSVFIREACLRENEGRLMCGLTIDGINAAGGVNINKYLAYLALSNSATDSWPDFDIDRSIVVEDFETNVRGLVDYIDSETYQIERRVMDVPIPHMDGCGLVLPSLSKKNFMVRLPWVKGLLASFPFDKFVREANRSDPKTNHGLIRDIYGVEHDVLAEDIQIIFTRSQFKMAKYYSSWEQYKAFFRQYGCEAGICNVEEDSFERAKINYQMLQTLTDLTDDELRDLSRHTIEKLSSISSSRETMLSVFGATTSNGWRNAFQESLMLYPELLQDEYCRNTLRMIKAKIEKEAVAGRLDIEGYYTFLIPDLYAFCQWLFLGQSVPSGLLRDGEVYCRLFEPDVELDCLRSPHLYKEHAVRRNMYGVCEEAKRWFQTDGIYTSTWDTISRILQFDNDGDKSLVVSEPTLVRAAKRNMEGVVPLFYHMKKAGARMITNDAIYESMIAAYVGGNIGQISNDITKIWNSSSEIDLDAVKYLVMENNFTIDYAKTLFKPTRPEAVGELIHSYTKSKVPAFFVEAKGKTDAQVAPINESCVNRLRRVIPVRRLNFSAEQLGKFDWRMLCSTDVIPNNELTQRIIDTYKKRSATMVYRFDDETGYYNGTYLCGMLREELLGIHPDIDFIVDVLVKHLFGRVKTSHKNMFWECFGWEVLQNLRANVDANAKMCTKCGLRFYRDSPRQVMCKACGIKHAKAFRREYNKKKRQAAGGVNF